MLCGKQFRQNTAMYTVSTINPVGVLLKRQCTDFDLTLSLTIIMYLSISVTCSSQLVILYDAHMFSHMSKLPVDEYVAYPEASCLKCIDYLSKGCNNCCHFLIFNELRCSKMNGLGGSHDEWDSIYIHNINI